MPRASGLALFISLLGSSIAAQLCRGYAPFQSRPVHVFTRGEFSNRTTTYGGGIGFGGAGVFGDLNLQGVSIDAFGASAFSVGGDLGLALPLDRKHTAEVCPLTEIARELGPNNLDNGAIHYRETDYAFGAAMGVSVNGNDHLISIVPVATYVHLGAHNSFTDTAGVKLSSHNRTSAVLTLGVGFIVNRDVSITPSAAWGTGSTTVVGLRLAFALGGGRMPIIGSHPPSCAGLPSTDSTIYDSTQVTERPRLRSAPELRYPQLQRDLAIGGRVILELTVDADGVPDSTTVQVVQSVDPAIDREALRWIVAVSYWPACRAGRPVRVHIAQPVDFCPAGCKQGKS